MFCDLSWFFLRCCAVRVDLCRIDYRFDVISKKSGALSWYEMVMQIWLGRCYCVFMYGLLSGYVWRSFMKNNFYLCTHVRYYPLTNTWLNILSRVSLAELIHKHRNVIISRLSCTRNGRFWSLGQELHRRRCKAAPARLHSIQDNIICQFTFVARSSTPISICTNLTIAQFDCTLRLRTIHNMKQK